MFFRGSTGLYDVGLRGVDSECWTIPEGGQVEDRMYLLFFIAGFLAGCGCCWATVSAWIESLRQELRKMGSI
ncbi:MAG: hypothetical protein JWP25_8329 [Bradyrhizobium sp.]|nr:hypothetical protein [Bradyrhizobium sp.]